MKFLITLLSLPLVALADEPDQLSPLEGKVRELRFNELSIVDAALPEAIETIRKAAFDIDSVPDISKRGVTFVVIADAPVSGNPQPAVSVTYSGKNVTLETVLREIARTARREIYLTSAGIVVTPVGIAPFPNPVSEKGEIFRKVAD